MGENAGFMQSRPCEAVVVLIAVLKVVSLWERESGLRGADPLRLRRGLLSWKLSVGGRTCRVYLHKVYFVGLLLFAF